MSGVPAAPPSDHGASARAVRGPEDVARAATALPARAAMALPTPADRRRAPRRPSRGATSLALGLAIAPVGLVACVAAAMRLLAGFTGLAGSPPAPPADPPWAAPLALQGPGPAYALPVPLAVQSASARADLGDLRVRNARGESLPIAWLAPRPPSDRAQPAPATIRRATAPGAGTTAAWIVEIRRGGADGESALDRLDLALSPRSQGVYALRVEASDDGQHWTLARPAAPVVQLAAPPAGITTPIAGAPAAALVSTAIDLDGVSARYLRLGALEGGPPPEIAGVLLTRVPRQALRSPIEWSDTIAPSACEGARCDYPLPPNVPVEQLEVMPADAGVAARVTVLGEVTEAALPMCRHVVVRDPLRALREHPDALATLPAGTAWEPLATAEVYRTAATARFDELRSPPLRLDGQAWPVLRLQVDGPPGQLGHVPPLLRVGVHPRTLVFLAQGPGPFRLERSGGAAASSGSTQALAALAALDAAAYGTATLQPAIAAAAATPSAAAALLRAGPSWTWAVLFASLAAVGAMAAMAWSRRFVRAAASGHTPDIAASERPQRAAPVNW